MKTMAPIDPQDNLELTAAETLASPRWSVPSQLAEPQIIYKKKQKLVVETEETLIV